MFRQIASGVLIIAVGAGVLAGCKKESPEKTETAQTVPAPAPAPSLPENKKTGEALFKQHCLVCHPDGGNIIKKEKTLHRKDLEANNITKPEDIVKTMRNPGPGMNKFDESTVPDTDAMAIGEYILETFK
jgi:mono/diheme cytochrome c family protein